METADGVDWIAIVCTMASLRACPAREDKRGEEEEEDYEGRGEAKVKSSQSGRERRGKEARARSTMDRGQERC